MNRTRAAKILFARGWSLKDAWPAVKSLAAIDFTVRQGMAADYLMDSTGEGQPVQIGFLLLAFRVPHGHGLEVARG